MSKLKVGDIAITQNMVFEPQWNGHEVEIIGGLEMRAWIGTSGTLGEGMAYLVRWPDGAETAQGPNELRLKRPPRPIDELVSWESVGWMPMDVKLDRAIKQALCDQVRVKA
jgi:hypothetical protein